MLTTGHDTVAVAAPAVEMVTVLEAASRLGTHVETVRRRLRSGELTGERRPLPRGGWQWFVSMPVEVPPTPPMWRRSPYPSRNSCNRRRHRRPMRGPWLRWRRPSRRCVTGSKMPVGRLLDLMPYSLSGGGKSRRCTASWPRWWPSLRPERGGGGGDLRLANRGPSLHRCRWGWPTSRWPRNGQHVPIAGSTSKSSKMPPWHLDFLKSRPTTPPRVRGAASPLMRCRKPSTASTKAACS